MKRKINITTLFLLAIFSFNCKPTQTAIIDNQPPVFFDEDACGDLVLIDLEVVETKKSQIIVAYKLFNKGDAPVSLLGATKNKNDNVAIKMYYSRDDELQRGDILIGGKYISNKALKDKGGKLSAGETYAGTIKVSTKKKTSFTPFLILNVDAWETVQECDETNNQIALEVKYKG